MRTPDFTATKLKNEKKKIKFLQPKTKNQKQNKTKHAWFNKHFVAKINSVLCYSYTELFPKQVSDPRKF